MLPIPNQRANVVATCEQTVIHSCIAITCPYHLEVRYLLLHDLVPWPDLVTIPSKALHCTIVEHIHCSNQPANTKHCQAGNAYHFVPWSSRTAAVLWQLLLRKAGVTQYVTECQLTGEQWHRSDW